MYPNSVKVKYYKCFKDKLEGFERILPINIIIGKNNSGKSSLIDIIEVICSKSNSISEIYTEYTPNFQQFQKHLEDLYGSGQVFYKIERIYNLEKIGNKSILYKNENIGKSQAFRWPKDGELNKLSQNSDGINISKIFERISFSFFDKYKFKRINAERDINAEGSSHDLRVGNNGNGLTNLIQQFLNRKDLQKQKLIRHDFLHSINSVVNPEIEFTEISVQFSPDNSLWEICFEDKFGNNIFLSQMGSGIKTIMLVLANLLLIPALEGIRPENYIYAFEELENNLHPSLQRKLYHFINEFALKAKCIFFITTHSNIGIDIFYNNEMTQLITVTNKDGVSKCETIVQNHHLNDLLHLLGFRASDLLQTNGVIWVEGPSDRNYIKKWLSLIDDTLIEGVHYSIMFYGGKLLSHLTFRREIVDDFILLLKINKNSYVVIDKDGKRESDSLNKTKMRIQAEIGEENCWVTKGREIENYLSKDSLHLWLQNRKISSCNNFSFGTFDKLENTLTCISPLYNANKNGYSREISNFITKSDLSILDLETKITLLVKTIKSWNF